MEAEILSLAEPRADQSEVYGVEVDRTAVVFRANEFHSQETRLTRGFGLRVVKDGRRGFAASSNPDRIDELVAAAVETAALGRPTRVIFPSSAERNPVKTFDNRVIMLATGKMTDWGTELVEAVRARIPDCKLDLTLTRTYHQVRVVNSSGLDFQYARAELSLHANGLLVLDGVPVPRRSGEELRRAQHAAGVRSPESGIRPCVLPGAVPAGTPQVQEHHNGLFWFGEFENLSSGVPLAIGKVADRLETKARLARTRPRLQSGVYPVIFAPEAVPNLLLPIEYAVSGKALEKGTSLLAGKVGQQLLDPKLTVTDNGLRDFGLASSPVDGEGTVCRRVPLFEKGIFRGFLFDLETAAACHQVTTGAARRGYTSIPMPGTSNIEVAVGTSRFEDVLGGIKEGLLVYDCIGGGQSNTMAGEVALNVFCGYKVEGGRVAGRVKDAAISANVFELLRQVEAVGDTQHDLGNYFVPFLVLGGVKVAAR